MVRLDERQQQLSAQEQQQQQTSLHAVLEQCISQRQSFR